MRKLVIVSELAAAVAVIACAVIALRGAAAPQAYIAPLLALILVVVSESVLHDRPGGIVLVAVGVAVCVGLVAARWAFALTPEQTARLLEREHPADGPVRCVSGAETFGRGWFTLIHLCGNKKFGDWDDRGGIRPDHGVGVEVNDTHVVDLYP